MTITEKHYRHFMVDCETLGTLPNKHHVLQIAAVLFNPDTFEPEVDAEGKVIAFECFLPLADQMVLGRQADAGTVKWWQSKDKEAVAPIVFGGVSKAPPLKDQLNLFSDWISQHCKVDNKFAESVFWAKPTAFDYPFIDGLFVESNVPSPFHFRKVVDVASYITSALKNTHFVLNHYHMTQHIAVESYWAAFEKVKKAHKGRKDAHNASADCIFQLDWLKESIDNLGYYVSEQGIKETLSRKD